MTTWATTTTRHTRSPTGGLQVPKDGLAMLALRTDATIVPIGISNTDRIWPKGRAFPLPGKHATMRIGGPRKGGDLMPPGRERRAAKGPGRKPRSAGSAAWGCIASATTARTQLCSRDR